MRQRGQARSTTMITLKATLVTADVELRAELEPLSDYKLIQAAAGTPAPCVTRRSRRGDAAHAQLARRRWLLLHQEVKDHSRPLRLLTKQVAPRLVEAVGAGCHIAAEMPPRAGDNGSRIKVRGSLPPPSTTSPDTQRQGCPSAT